jgi:hypothetical protein
MAFAEQIQRFAQRSIGQMDAIVRKVGIDVARSLIMKSPVDTGRFRGNWMLGVGSLNPETHMDITDPSGNGSINRITEGILQGVRSGTVFYLSNSLPYAIPLEYGHSKQAPQGMVRLTVLEFRSFLDGAVQASRELRPL